MATAPAERTNNKADKKQAKETRIITVANKLEFDRLLAEAGNKHILVEFYATWCGPCRLIGQRLEELAKEYDGRLIILKIDVDDVEELADEHDVSSMPTFMIYKNKVKLEQFVGSNSEKVESTVQKFCGKPEDAKVGAATAQAEAADTTGKNKMKATIKK